MKILRLIDFVVLLISLDLWHFVITLALWMLLGPDKDNAVFAAVTPILSAALLWTKLGLGVLVIKKVPFREDKPNASVAFKKIWVLSLFWPFLFTNKR